MDRRAFGLITVGAVFGWSISVCAQPPARTRGVGSLAMVPRANMDIFLAKLRSELEEFGWTEGSNVVFMEPKTAVRENARLPPFASERVVSPTNEAIAQFVKHSAGRRSH